MAVAGIRRAPPGAEALARGLRGARGPHAGARFPRVRPGRDHRGSRGGPGARGPSGRHGPETADSGSDRPRSVGQRPLRSTSSAHGPWPQYARARGRPARSWPCSSPSSWAPAVDPTASCANAGAKAPVVKGHRTRLGASRSRWRARLPGESSLPRQGSSPPSGGSKIEASTPLWRERRAARCALVSSSKRDREDLSWLAVAPGACRQGASSTLMSLGVYPYRVPRCALRSGRLESGTVRPGSALNVIRPGLPMKTTHRSICVLAAGCASLAARAHHGDDRPAGSLDGPTDPTVPGAL